MKTQIVCAGLLYAFAPLSPAAVPRDFAVDLKAVVSDAAPHIVLSWSQRVQSNITAQKIHRRLKGGTTWVKQADLNLNQTSYTDLTATAGVEYEYWMERTLSGLNPTTAIGYLSAGIKVPEVHARGMMLLLIDDTMITPLAPEIARLQLDLAADGWTVQTISTPRVGTAVSTKALIASAYNADPVNVKAVYLLGHVPVPYSGNQAPDGHSPDHVGAWPADGYYGEMNGTWTDTTVTNTGAASARNDNIPGDGKFDQISFPSLVELQVGRVDLHTMTKAPGTAVTEVTRLRRYLQRAHAFRHKLGPYANIPRRTLIRDGFGHAFGSEPFAAVAWAGAFSSVGTDITEAPGGQWFSAPYAGGKDYLWGHGCGGGSYESASGFGNTDDFGYKPSRVVFTSLFGSYHGDWDAGNNLMRAAIAGNQDGDSLGLVCFWTGRPHWFMHHLGMGETVGYAARVSMNSLQSGGGSYLPNSSSARGVHIGLMGDPGLRLHVVQPPGNLAATSASGAVDLTWSVSTDTAVQGYHVYRSESAAGPFTKLTTFPLAGTSYTDDTAAAGASYIYLVRTLKLEAVPGGSYYNLSVGSSAAIRVNDGAQPAPRNPTGLAAVHQTGGLMLSWQDNSADETGFRIERKTNATGSFTAIATVAEDVTTHTDPGPFAHGSVYFYRVVATGSTGDSPASGEVSFEGITGFVEFANTRMKVNKTAGTASVSVVRSGGGVGAVSVTCSTSNASATSGTHYTSSTGSLAWADGEQGAKTFTVPITNTAAPQLPRHFKVSLGSPSGGLVVSLQSVMAVQIEDPSATLPSPWTAGLIGTLADSSPAVSAEGVIGDSTMGGSGAVQDATSDAGRFIFQTRTGDGMMTMQVLTPPVAQSSARFALMVRPSTTSNTVMATTITASSAANYGTRFVSRAATGAAAVASQTTDNNLDTPRWLRLSRFGNVFSSETSADGSAWTSLGSTTIASMPATAVWGIFHYSAAPNSTSQVGDYHLAIYQNVSLSNLGAPHAPASFAATPGPGGISLSWNDASIHETGFGIERQVANGTWQQLQTVPANSVSFPDASALPGVSYQYRIRALSATGDSSWATVAATAAGTASGYRLWLLANGLPMDESGAGSATATPANDELPNLVKYALGLPPSATGSAGRLATGILPHATGADHLTFSYTCPDPRPAGISYAVETGSDLLPTGWSVNGITPVGDTVTGGLRTVIVRLTSPTSAGGTHFMRLKISQQ